MSYFKTVKMNNQNIRDAHKGGKLEIRSKNKITTMEDLSTVYTPGVGRMCLEIAEDPKKAKSYTMSGNTMAVISDGSAVLGLGDIGAVASLPVMEGKCAILKEFAGVQAYPLVFQENDVETFIQYVKAVAINFSAINLEDISAPRCFEIEKRLSEELSIPVMHDDQHGTAIVTFAALKGALELTKKKNVVVSILGAGAGGHAVAKLLLESMEELSIAEVRVIDSKGLLSSARSDLNPYKKELASQSKQSKNMSYEESLIGSDVFIGVATKDLLNKELISKMNNNPIIFALSNPDPEIHPHEALEAGASIVATGRSDYPNQVNNALAYPGVFKGLIEGKISSATTEIKLAAARAIYEYNKPNLSKESILPSILDKNIPKIISEAVVSASKR